MVKHGGDRRATTAGPGGRGLLGLLLALVLLAGGATGGTAAPPPASEALAIGAAELALGQAAGLVAAPEGGIELAALAAAPPAETPYARAGSLIGPSRPLAMPATTLVAGWTGATPPGTAVRLEVRGAGADGRLSPWEEVPNRAGLVYLPWPATTAQYRLTLLALAAAPTPFVHRVRMEAAPGLPVAPTLAAAAVTARVYATRIGLIGGQTSNGHIIMPADRFVALPSRRVLASRGGDEYRVRVEYRGKSLTLPVWDTGPWNVRDNYWETTTRRDMWNDLPPGQPQAAAAYFDAYHGGRDGFGRRVLSPAGLDLSDAAFQELGLTHSDWVSVTFLWLGS